MHKFVIYFVIYPICHDYAVMSILSISRLMCKLKPNL